MKTRSSLIVLLILAPAIPELLTGSTPFWRFLNPVNLAVLVVVYGFPALLYREYVVRCGLNYHRLLLFGLAQGILVEGLAVNTFYNDDPSRMGDFAHYGRFLGVNWPWSFYLVMFHSIWSVYVPVILTESFHHEIHSQPLIDLTSKRKIIIVSMVAFVILLFQLSRDVYHPNPIYQLFALAAMSIILIKASKAGRINPSPFLKRIIYPYKSYTLVLYPFIFILFEFYMLSRILLPIIHIAVGILTYYSLYNLVSRLDTIQHFKTAIYLTLGLSLQGILAVLLDHQYHILPASLLFIILSIYAYKRIGKPGYGTETTSF